jgi:protein-disulfide isomerase
MAGRCANEQNKFWEYHNLLFDNKDQLGGGKFIELAKNLKLDGGKFEKCLSDGRYKQQIIDNLLEANALEINGVPFVYVNNQEVMGEISFEDLEEMIEGELMK